MAKRIPAILLALYMLFSAAFCFAAGPDDEDGDEDFESTQNSGFEEEDQKNQNALNVEKYLIIPLIF